MTELEIKESLAKEEFRLRSLSEAKLQSKEIADEIQAILRKHKVSLVECNNNLYIVPQGFQLYSKWNCPCGVEFEPVDIGLTCQRYDCDYIIVKPFPETMK